MKFIMQFSPAFIVVVAVVAFLSVDKNANN
jgi:hypothetical protein